MNDFERLDHRRAKDALDAAALILGCAPSEVPTKVRGHVDRIKKIKAWLALGPDEQRTWVALNHIVFHNTNACEQDEGA